MNLQQLSKSNSMLGTDKGKESHSFHGRSYLDVYEKYFSQWRDEEFNMLEIGVFRGHSLRLWAEYFKRAQIYGLDIDPVALQRDWPTDRIHPLHGDQSERAVLGMLSSQNYRIIIDDGSHVLEHMIKSFSYLWPSIQPGGFYVMEDMRVSYGAAWMGWPGMKHNREGMDVKNDRHRIEELILEKIDLMDHHEGDIASVLFYPMQILIEKTK